MVNRIRVGDGVDLTKISVSFENFDFKNHQNLSFFTKFYLNFRREVRILNLIFSSNVKSYLFLILPASNLFQQNNILTKTCRNKIKTPNIIRKFFVQLPFFFKFNSNLKENTQNLELISSSNYIYSTSIISLNLINEVILM